ncbi:sugar nucleotide-binding protein [Heliobacterium gestii]|uniref:dTDP-4-dehydrorhamnose reductase n=1 Tax=Heliomicrobium gestii TaxID=2699 RepID=A0A845LHU0_HELGE|nr:sugar nucleotide-binding protein [Heliomicrobium gestii]MBM7866697.1 dTDP-4-dehydrorhamnose reductase [Heliomicrobium gestii]MZP43023.1 sugar nucleotide-binding protein [Heliomicrobium gestii]
MTHKLLVIGASGLIGRHVFTLAQKEGFDVIGTRCSNGNPAFRPYNLLEDDIADVMPASFLPTSDAASCHAVICAAVPKIDYCFTHREESRQMHVERTLRLVKRLDAWGVKTIYISSDTVFDGVRGYYDESMPPNPICEYGRQKADVEAAYEEFFPNHLVLRLSVIVGDDPAEGHILSRWHQSRVATGQITCIEGQILSPTYVGDVAEGVIRSIEGNLSGLYHLANSEFFTGEELARQFLFGLGESAKVIPKTPGEIGLLDRRPQKTYLNGSRFRQATAMSFTSMSEVFRRFRQRAGAEEGQISLL